MYSVWDEVELIVPKHRIIGARYEYTNEMICIFEENPKVKITEAYWTGRYQVVDCQWHHRWVEPEWIVWPYNKFTLFL